MGTANFLNKHARFIYAREIDDEFEYEDLIEDLRQSFRTAGEYPKTKAIAEFEEVYDTWESENTRSYPGRIIAFVWSETNRYRDFEAFLSADIVVRSGYYSGVNLDHDIRLRINGEETGIDDDDIEATIAYLTGLPRGRARRDARFVRKWVDRQYGSFADAIEAVFAAHSTPLTVRARFSNGETWYEEA